MCLQADSGTMGCKALLPSLFTTAGAQVVPVPICNQPDSLLQEAYLSYEAELAKCCLLKGVPNVMCRLLC